MRQTEVKAAALVEGVDLVDLIDQAEQREVCGQRGAIDAIVVVVAAVADVAAGYAAAVVVVAAGSRLMGNGAAIRKGSMSAVWQTPSFPRHQLFKTVARL